MAIQPSFAGESPILNDITISVLAGSFTLVSRRNACQLKSAKAPPDTIFELDFTFGRINYSSLPFFSIAAINVTQVFTKSANTCPVNEFSVSTPRSPWSPSGKLPPTAVLR